MRYALAAVLLLAGMAWADMPRGGWGGHDPQTPHGKKRVDVKTEVRLAKGVSGWVFVAHTSERFLRQYISQDQRLELGDGKTHPISDGSRHFSADLYVIPESEAKGYSADELVRAIGDKKVTGAQHLDLPTTADVGGLFLSNPVTWTYTITAIDEGGIHTTVSGLGSGDDQPGKPKPAGVSIPGGWCAGFAAAVGVTAGGLWLVRRRGRR